jgi:hypothetical protein
MSENIEERLLDLLCKKAMSGLNEQESRELTELERSVESPVDLQSLELTAAAISTAGLRRDEKLPDHLKAGILKQADDFFTELNAAKSLPRSVVAEPEPSRTSIWTWLGWGVAALASLLLIANIWITNSRGPQLVGPGTTPTPTPEQLDPAQLRDRLMASAPDLVKAEWAKGNMPEVAAAGDVVWSDAMQEGYVRLSGMPKNDRATSTYQLWIYDETQDAKTPIDGGTFDVTEDGEVVIPIDAKLRARNPSQFAITMEKPGGVVVSKAEKVPALAKVKLNQSS